jgi:transposase
MDVHNETMAVASGAQEHGAAVISLGTRGTRPCASAQLVRNMPAKATHLIFVSEAGPCGSWLSRYLTTKGYDCWGVAPSLLPKKSGDRVTTNRRDAMPLARLARSGDLPLVSGPHVDEEAIRALTRAREATSSALTDAQCRLTAFVLRPDSRSAGRATWGPAHRRWRAEGVCPTAAQPSVLQDDVRAMPESPDRRQRLAQARQAQGPVWRLPPVVEALQALRGVPCTGAVTIVAAIGALTRFEPPRALMQCLGLLPSEDSTGAHRRQGAMTKAGHTQARRALGEGAWASR